MSTLLLTLLLTLTPQSLAGKKVEIPAANWYITDANKAALSEANSLLAQKKFAEAVVAYEALLVKEPECGVVLVGAARAHMGKAEPAAAVPQLQKATSLFGDKPDVWVTYGQSLLAVQNYPDAVMAARKALELRPTNADALWVAQQGLVAVKDYAGAHTMLGEARTRGWLPVIDCMDGMVYAREGNRPKAVEMQATCRDFRPWSDQLAEAVNALPAPAVPTAGTTPPTP